MRISLRAPTENSLAQAVWSRREVGMDFDFHSLLKEIPNANEARVRAAYEVGHYQTSSDECLTWLEDESFSARAALTGAFVSSCLLAQYESTLVFAERGLRANPNEPMLTNSKLLALCYLGRAAEAEQLLPNLTAF